MKKILIFLLNTYYELLDWLIILFLMPFPKYLSRKSTFFLIRLTNVLHFFYSYKYKKIFEAHRSLESYRNEYDMNGWNIYNMIIEEDGWLRGKRILDIGCFVGAKAECMLDHGAREVVGIDLSKRGIEVAQKYERENLRYYCMSSSALKQEMPEYFDTIVSYTVFEHIDRDLLLEVINDGYDLLKKGGIFLIVYNHYSDRFGSHLPQFIYLSHPTVVFPENIVYEYANQLLKKYNKIGKMGYFPEGFNFGQGHNNDSYMALNKLNNISFIEIIKQSRLNKHEYIQYSQTWIMKILSRVFPDNDLFKGSYLYLLKK